jgi:hypothetical protein
MVRYVVPTDNKEKTVEVLRSQTLNGVRVAMSAFEPAHVVVSPVPIPALEGFEKEGDDIPTPVPASRKPPAKKAPAKKAPAKAPAKKPAPKGKGKK